MNRRTFLRSSAVLAAFSPVVRATAADQKSTQSTVGSTSVPKRPRSLKKGFMFGTLNSPTARALSLRDKFQLVRDAGFAGVEVPSAMNQQDVLAARDACGLEIPSVVISTHW